MAPDTVFTLDAEDWARSRFVRSLLWETVQATRTVIHPPRQVHHRAWLDTVDRVAARSHLPVLSALNPRAGWVPDFLAPPPEPGDRSLDDELALVADYPTRGVAADVRRSLRSHPTRARQAVLEPLIAAPATARELILAELRWAWDTLLAPHWAPVHELIAADIAYRSREIVRTGLGRTLEGLHPDVGLRDGAVVLRHRDDLTVDLAGRGLTLMPSAFVWPGVIAVVDAPWQPTVVYPARGIGELWTTPPAAPAALAGVLGSTRALLIADLLVPSTTTALAARHGLSPAAVSTQLGLLRAAGLVSTRRLGKEVFYRRTPLAEGLLHGG